jgi:Neuraminidase (sialidase)
MKKLLSFVFVMVLTFILYQACTTGDSNSPYSKDISNPTFSRPINISNTGSSHHPVIAADSAGNIYVVWTDYIWGFVIDDFDIYFSRSTDGGLTWSQAINPTNKLNSGGCDIAVDSIGNINVVWNVHSGDDRGIYFSHSTDEGLTWSQAVNIPNKFGYIRSAKMAMDSVGNIYVVWSEESRSIRDLYDIFFSRSMDNGATWSQPVNIPNNLKSSNTEIAVDNSGNINVVWADITTIGGRDIFISRSSDNGLTWSQPVNISKKLKGLNPKIAVDSARNIYVVWEEEGDEAIGSDKLFFSRSTDDGNIWSQAVNITSSSAHPDDPDIAVDSSGNINLVWCEYIRGIYFSRSTNNGSTWSKPVNIYDSLEGESMNPAITVGSAGNINVVWEESISRDDDYIYFTRGTR